MRRFLVRGILALLPAASALLTIGVSPAASDLSLQSVNLACSDATRLDLALDATAVSSLADAVSAMNLYPAGDPALSCVLNPAPAGSGNPHFDYAVGGGQAALFGPQDNFQISVHAPAAPTGTAVLTSGGTLNLTSPYGPTRGKVVAKPDCLEVGRFGPGTAQATGPVTQATGFFSFLAGQELEVDMLDSGVPGGTGDHVGYFSTDSPCEFGPSNPYAAVQHGNITVHDG